MNLSHLPGITRIEPLAWERVFAIWRANEGDGSSWGAHARERGFPDWATWRMTYANAFGLPERSWASYTIADPVAAIPTFRGGPFSGWVRRFYDGDPHPTFAALAARPDVRAHAYVQRLLANFPRETTITGLLLDAGIVIVEGMHRCCAVAIAAADGTSLETAIHIALADARGETLPITGESTAQ